MLCLTYLPQQTRPLFSAVRFRKIMQNGCSGIPELCSKRMKCMVHQNGNGKVVYEDVARQVSVTYQQATQVAYDEVSQLLEKVGWPARAQSRMDKAVESSYFVATLQAHRGSGAAKLIGLARVVSDGIFNAHIWDVVVDPSYQGLGLGKILVEEVVRHLVDEGINNIVTFAEKKGTKFYQKMGFEVDPDGVRGMFWRELQ